MTTRIPRDYIAAQIRRALGELPEVTVRHGQSYMLAHEARMRALGDLMDQMRELYGARYERGRLIIAGLSVDAADGGEAALRAWVEAVRGRYG